MKLRATQLQLEDFLRAGSASWPSCRTLCHTAASFDYETQKSNSWKCHFRRGYVPLCVVAPPWLPFGISPIASALCWKVTFAFARELARWKYPFQSMRHFHYHQTCQICMRFRSIDASATHIHKGLPLPPAFQHIHCTPVHHRYLGFDSFLQCPPSPQPPPLRSPHRSVTAVPLTRSRTPSTKVGAPFRHRRSTQVV